MGTSKLFSTCLDVQPLNPGYPLSPWSEQHAHEAMTDDEYLCKHSIDQVAEAGGDQQKQDERAQQQLMSCSTAADNVENKKKVAEDDAASIGTDPGSPVPSLRKREEGTKTFFTISQHE